MSFGYLVGMTFSSMLTGLIVGAVLMGHTTRGEIDMIEQELSSCYDFNAAEDALFPRTKETSREEL